MIRLGIDAWGLGGNLLYTGMGQYAAQLLAGIDEEDINVVAYGAPHETRPTWLPERVEWTAPVSHAPRKLAALASRAYSLRRIVASDRIDVFHAPGVHVRPSMPPIPSVPCPLIATVHDLIPITYYGRSLPLRLRWFYRWNLLRALRAGRIITVSNASRADLVAHADRAAHTISVIPNGVDFAREDDGPRLAGRLIQQRYILYAGSYEPRKNFAGALDAYERLVRRGLDYDLVAIVDAGSGHAEPLRQRMAAPPLRGRVHAIDSLPERDLRSVYTHAAVLLFPSFAEGFGFPPLQAAACGVPVVSADLPAVQETMAGSALFVAPTDAGAMAGALDLALNDDRTRGRMIEQGWHRVAQYTKERSIAAHVASYREAAASTSGGRNARVRVALADSAP